MADTWLHDSLMKLAEQMRPIADKNRAFYHQYGPSIGWLENVDASRAELFLLGKAREALR